VASSCPAEFDREQGFTERDWLRCLPGAVGSWPLDLRQPGRARVQIGAGTLTLHWQTLAPRQIGLARFPRMAMQYRFEAVAGVDRDEFMRYFDLYTMRGGG
jgi:hypothetical protein